MLYKKISIDSDNAKTSGNQIAHELTENKIVHCSKKLDSLNFYVECSKYIGNLMPMEEHLENGEKTGNFFTDIKYPFDKISKSFSHSNNRQPLHTDGSYEFNAPQISFFYCLKKADFGGATVFIDSDFLVSVLDNYSPTMLEELKSTPVEHSKGNDGKKRPIIGDNNILTWNFYRCEKSHLTNEFHKFLENKIVGGGLVTPVLLDVGDVIFFKDEEILHGRNSFIGERWLKKGGIKLE